MLKFGGGTQPGDKPLLVLGITRRNVEALADGQPILVKAADVKAITGRDVDVAIMFGETDQHLVAQVRAAGVELPPGTDEAIRAMRKPGESTL